MLKASLQRAGYFLLCKCRPTEDLELSPPRHADLFGRAVLHRKRRLAPDVWELLLEPATSLYYHAGQFVNLRRADGLTRSYSLASLPTEDELLTLHIKRLPGGAMTSWIFDELAEGDELDLQGPNGRCYYVPGSQDQDLLLIGNGTGVAPLVGIVRDALHVGHRAWVRSLTFVREWQAACVCGRGSKRLCLGYIAQRSGVPAQRSCAGGLDGCLH